MRRAKSEVLIFNRNNFTIDQQFQKVFRFLYSSQIIMHTSSFSEHQLIKIQETTLQDLILNITNKEGWFAKLETLK